MIDLAAAEAALAEHLEREGNIGSAVTPGVGKTHAAIRRAMTLARDEVVVMAMPEHGLIEEWMGKAKAVDGTVPMAHIKGGMSEKTSCKRTEEVERAWKAGYYPSQTTCFRCEFHPDNSSSRFICRYYRQFEPITRENRGLIFCATHSLPYIVRSRMIYGLDDEDGL